MPPAPYGIRVPGLVLGAYARQGVIDHDVHSHDSYVRLVEDLFLDGERIDPATDGRPDPRTSVREEMASTLLADFDFTRTRAPWAL